MKVRASVKRICVKCKVVRRKGVVRIIKRFDAGDNHAALPIWRMAIVEQWARQFLDKAAT